MALETDLNIGLYYMSDIPNVGDKLVLERMNKKYNFVVDKVKDDIVTYTEIGPTTFGSWENLLDNGFTKVSGGGGEKTHKEDEKTHKEDNTEKLICFLLIV